MSYLKIYIALALDIISPDSVAPKLPDELSGIRLLIGVQPVDESVFMDLLRSDDSSPRGIQGMFSLIGVGTYADGRVKISDVDKEILRKKREDVAANYPSEKVYSILLTLWFGQVNCLLDMHFGEDDLYTLTDTLRICFNAWTPVLGNTFNKDWMMDAIIRYHCSSFSNLNNAY